MTLIIETCTERGVVAFAEDGQMTDIEELPYGLNNSKNLMPAIKKVLNTRKPLSIVLGVGPGSYTGIRVGAMAAKTLAFVWDIPLYAVSTLEGFEQVPILDAKISGAYIKLPGKPPQVCSLDQVDDLLHGVSLLVSPKVDKIQQKLDQLYPGQWSFEEKGPDPILLLQAAQKTEPLKHDDIELLYLRKTQAELERKSVEGVK